MEIKGSTTYAAAATQLAATEKNTELAKQQPAAPNSTAIDTVTISDQAKALQSIESGETQTDDVPPGWPPTDPEATALADDVPPGWPPTPPSKS